MAHCQVLSIRLELPETSTPPVWTGKVLFPEDTSTESLRPLRNPQKEYAQGPMVVLGGGAVSHERGALVVGYGTPQQVKLQSSPQKCTFSVKRQ
jgi:hypothetical protein